MSSFDDLGPSLQPSFAAQNNPEVTNPLLGEKSNKADDAAMTAGDKRGDKDTKQPLEESKQTVPLDQCQNNPARQDDDKQQEQKEQQNQEEQK